MHIHIAVDNRLASLQESNLACRWSCPSGACALISLSLFPSLSLSLIYLSLSPPLPTSLSLSFHQRGVRYLWLHKFWCRNGFGNGIGIAIGNWNSPAGMSLAGGMVHGNGNGTVAEAGGREGGGVGRYVNKPFWRVLRALPTTGKFTISSFTWPIVRNVYAMLLVILYSNTHTHTHTSGGGNLYSSLHRWSQSLLCCDRGKPKYV